NHEVNVSSAFKKSVVPRKQRSITIADNLVPQENVAVELAKSVSIEEQRLQQRDIMTQLTIKRQIEKDVEDMYAEWEQKLKDDEIDDYDMDLSDDKPKGDDDGVGFGVFMYNKSTKPLKSTYLSLTVNPLSLDYIQNLLNEPPVNELMDLMSNPVYTDAHTTLAVANLEGNLEITSYIYQQLQQITSNKFPTKLTSSQSKEARTPINVSEAIKKAIQAKVLIEMKKHLPTYVPNAIAKYVKPRLNNSVCKVMQNNQISLFTIRPPTKVDDLSEMDLKLKLLNRMHQNKSYETQNMHQKLYGTLYESITLDQEALDAQDAEQSFNKRSHDDWDPLNDREGKTRKKERRMLVNILLDRQRKTKPLWFQLKKTLPLINPTTKKKIIFKLIPIQDGSQRTKKLKELIREDELTITDLEGVGLEKLKKQYKHYVELEYHVDQLKATVLTEAQWNNGKRDVSKPRSFKIHMSKSTKPHLSFYNNDFYYLVNLRTREKYATSLTKHFALRYPDGWSKKIHCYQIKALNGIHH
nr:hypothetical protein [Tanacetum cinerariifolium]